VVGSEHEDHLQELAGVVGQSAAEPQQRHDTTDANVFPEDIRDRHAGVEQLLATIVGDGGDEGGWLTDEAELLGPGVVDGNLGYGWLGRRLDGALLELLLVDLLEHLGQLLEGVGDVDAGLPHGLVLHGRGLELGVGERAGVTELDFGLEQTGNGTDGPSDDRLGDGAVLDRLDHAVLLDTANLTEKDEDLALRVLLVAQHVVDEGRTRISVTTNGHTLVHTVGGIRDDVVQLVGHTTGLGDVTDGALAVELGSHNVVHHTASVANLERTRLDATHGGRADDRDALLLGHVQNLTGAPFWDTLGDNGNGLDLGVLHQLHGGAVDGAGGGEVDHGVDVVVLCHGLFGGLIDGEEGLGGSPVPVWSFVSLVGLAMLADS